MPLLAELFDLALVDLDGVVYVGPDAVAGSVDAIAQSHRLGLRTAFVTNNAGRPASQVADHLRSLGIDVQDEDVVTSAMAAADLLAHRLPAGSAIGIVGGVGVTASVKAAGLRLVPISRGVIWLRQVTRLLPAPCSLPRTLIARSPHLKALLQEVVLLSPLCRRPVA